MIKKFKVENSPSGIIVLRAGPYMLHRMPQHTPKILFANSSHEVFVVYDVTHMISWKVIYKEVSR